MEPDVVLNYLKYVNQQTTKFIYLKERMSGGPLAEVKGKIGVLQQTTLEHFKNGLEDFQLVNMIKSLLLPRIAQSAYSYSFWKRRI